MLMFISQTVAYFVFNAMKKDSNENVFLQIYSNRVDKEINEYNIIMKFIVFFV
jgi:hypothetical protein